MPRDDIDLRRGVLPISAAASQLAKLLRQARDTSKPIIVTQKGYPSGVLLSIELYDQLRGAQASAAEPLPFTPPWAEAEAAAAD